MSRLELVAQSQAQESGFLALADIASLAKATGIEYRVVGGLMVALHLAVSGAAARLLARRSTLTWASRNRLPPTPPLSLGWKVWDTSDRNRPTGSSAKEGRGDAW